MSGSELAVGWATAPPTTIGRLASIYKKELLCSTWFYENKPMQFTNQEVDIEWWLFTIEVKTNSFINGNSIDFCSIEPYSSPV